MLGSHRSGKTLTLTRVVRGLRRAGRRVAVVKHSHHRFDRPGTDTDRFARAGADVVIFASDRTVAFVPRDALEFAGDLDVHVLLVEGYHRRSLGRRFRIRSPAESDRIARAILAYVDERLERRPRRAGSS